MKIRRAVITAAGRDQYTLPLQRLVDRDGQPKSALAIIVEEAIAAGAEEIAIVVRPGDEAAFRAAAGGTASRLELLPQAEPLGYGDAVQTARTFVGDEPFLHFVGDHLYVCRGQARCAQQLVAVAEAEACAVSAVQATREHLLPLFGTIGGKRIPSNRRLYDVATVVEKPTPTQAEQELIVPGLRAGHYLCFFGIHILPPTVFGHLAELGALGSRQLSAALALLATRERYLAYEVDGSRYNLGPTYGLLAAQLALALSGPDRDEVLTMLVDQLARSS
ncbi:MAG: UTP--glucose-1-phosphate uridylyltransferase [Planctomycetia bacterium]|nr:UTP--glucose-1-phosphate uridylyltransferase [Planctomycetia bacterium]